MRGIVSTALMAKFPLILHLILLFQNEQVNFLSR